MPHQYHDGGVKPFLGGFYVAALVQAGREASASIQPELLAEAVRQGANAEWKFNERHHGVTGRLMGHPLQAWSAGLYLYAYNAVRDERAAFF